MLDVKIPDLTFPDLQLGKNVTPWDLRPLLFKGGASSRVDIVADSIDAGTLGPLIVERVGLVQNIHEVLTASLTGGGSKKTAESQICKLRGFYGWADASGHPMNLENIEATYLNWTDYLMHRVRVIKDIKEQSAYGAAKEVGGVLDKVLERNSPIICNTRLVSKKKRKSVCGVQSDKQNLTETFELGHALLDIIDGLQLDSLWGPLPLRISLRSGQELEDWSGLVPPKPHWLNPQNRKQRYNEKRRQRRRGNYENDCTLRTRHSLVNLRIEAELLLFIGQTGMNLAQAHQLKVRHYSYKSSIDGYEVRDYKHRRQGEVMFEIFSEYKEVFERYLAWRKSVFPSDSQGLLFPLVRNGGRAEDTPPSFDRVLETCKKLGLRFIPPSQLRNTRINWMLRRSRDSDVTSDLAQHSKKTLLRVYEKPSLHVAMIEITRFWQSHDPALPSPAPGVCDGVPVPIIDIPPEAPEPDCVRPTGCLWCAHHRDIDSQDYVWSLASMRHLKTLVLNGLRPPEEGMTKTTRHVEMAIERLTAKLRWFRQSNELRRGWVVEALSRIDEAFYHPHWSYLIVAIEGD